MPLLRFWAAFFAVLGVCVLLYARRAGRLARESVNWLPVEATILHSEVVRDEQRQFVDDPAKPVIISYYPEIEYEYEAEGRKWRSNRLLAVRVNFPKTDAEAWVAQYPAGARVLARRHPRKPGLAVLQPGVEGFEARYRIPVIVGAGFLIVGVAGWVALKYVG
ncbi:MAG: DUF3592 domain-containing protein [Bryobacteraceae bacterium]